MTEILLIALIALILGFVAYREREHAKEKHDLMLAVMSKDTDDYLDLKIVENNMKDKPLPEPDPIVPIDTLSDDEFFKRIVEQANGKEKN